MNRLAAFVVAASALSAPAVAATYSAKPLAAPSAAKIIGKDISWARDGDTYRGSTEASRPMILCQDLAKRAGRLETFAADGKSLTAEQLAKCNTAAKDGANAELARVN